LDRAVVVVGHDLNVATESDYLISYLVFEADNYGYGDKHYGKTECYAYYSNTHCGTRHTFVVAFFSVEAVCYE
jgi:hypothetical protein